MSKKTSLDLQHHWLIFDFRNGNTCWWEYKDFPSQEVIDKWISEDPVKRPT